MDYLFNLLATKEFYAAAVGFFIFYLISIAAGRRGYRGAEEDKRLARLHSDYLDDSDHRWITAWMRQDISMIFGCLVIIAGLLGAILAVLLFKTT